MKAELLPYKYKALRFSDQYDEKAIVQLGWKARKYIKWNDVHVGEDRDLLKRFGDLAVDQKIIDHQRFPRMNEILLNVQYWRLDKNNFSVEPQHTAEWDKTRDLIIAGNENPNLVLSYLSDYYGDLNDISDDALYDNFLTLILSELVVSVRRIPDTKFSKDLVSTGFAGVVRYLASIDHELPEFKDIGDEAEAIEMFDLPQLNHLDLNVSFFEIKPLNQIIVIEEKLPRSKLLKIIENKGLVTVHLNSNNECIKFVNRNESLKDFFIKYITAYVKTSMENPSLSDELEDFNSYLSMNLNREFSED